MFKVECPGCKAPYQVDERRVPPSGLKMRCPKCGTTFKVEPPAVDNRRTGPSPVLGASLGMDSGPSQPPPVPHRSKKPTQVGVGVGIAGLGLGAKGPPRPSAAKPPIPKPALPEPDLDELDLPAIGQRRDAADLPAPIAPRPNADLPAPARRGGATGPRPRWSLLAKWTCHRSVVESLRPTSISTRICRRLAHRSPPSRASTRICPRWEVAGATWTCQAPHEVAPSCRVQREVLVRSICRRSAAGEICRASAPEIFLRWRPEVASTCLRRAETICPR